MPVTPGETALHLQARLADERRRGSERARRLLERVEHARTVLVEQRGARRVWVFGSLIHDTATPSSDIDLAVEGLPQGAYFDALAELMALFRGPVDLVCLEQAPDTLRERILAEGREL